MRGLTRMSVECARLWEPYRLLWIADPAVFTLLYGNGGCNRSLRQASSADAQAASEVYLRGENLVGLKNRMLSDDRGTDDDPGRQTRTGLFSLLYATGIARSSSLSMP